MNRFRFRVWNKNYKMYHDFEDLVISTSGKLLDRDRRLYDQGECIIEQCTGLKDKNGVLIFEGDILQSLCDSEHTCVMLWTGVRWVAKHTGDTEDYYMPETEFYEIIGQTNHEDEK